VRISKVSIDGYGRFAGLELDFAPGLQVIVGPNEKGKSTLRSFVGDMLYGQKRGAARLYEESNELRVPWGNPDCYGGTLHYVLDRGTRIEVVRNFDKERESIQVYDRTQDHDITGEFDRYRNGEVAFAAAHLGLSKDVFLGAATINHFSLEGLGDQDALERIREKLLSLADSGSELASAENALKRIEGRIRSIGRPNERGRLLPAAHAALLRVNAEYEDALEVQRELGVLEEKRRTLLAQSTELRQRRLAIEEELRTLEAHALSHRLREAENLVARINAATQHCFALGAVRDFPLESAPRVRRAENRVSTARVQLERTRAEYEQLEAQLGSERQELGSESPQSFADIPDESEERIGVLVTQVQHLRERQAEADTLVDAAQARIEEAHDTVSALPDFSRLSPDPVEWVTQLGSSFSIVVRTRDEECAVRDKLRKEIATGRDAIAGSEELFAECQDFPEQAREYVLAKRLHEDRISQRTSHLQTLQTAFDEATGSSVFLWMAIACCAVMVAPFGVYLFTQNKAVLVSVLPLLLAAVYFLISHTFSRSQRNRLEQRIVKTRRELEALQSDEVNEPGLIDRMMERAQCQSIRELEARYDQYREGKAELLARLEVLDDQEVKAREAEQRIPQLLERLHETFLKVGEDIECEADVQEAVGRAIARYQSYREAKRHVTDCRAILDKHQAEQKRLAGVIQQAQEELAALEAEVRRTMRENGFNEEEQHESITGALRAYRNRIARHRERTGRTSLLEEKVSAIAHRLEEESLDLEKHQQQLTQRLKAAGVDSVEQFHKKAEKAKEYQEVWDKRVSVEEQLDTLLGGQDIKELRETAASYGALPPAPKLTREQIKLKNDAAAAAIDECMAEEHALHIAITEKAAAARSLNEVEEERAYIERQVQELEVEHQAATYAMTLVEEVSRNKHAGVAPKLAARASAYLAEITEGAYDELVIGHDLTISVRIPQTKAMNDAPEKSLSKGTVDQIYFALRLALVQGISESGESTPMLLDDPFANYDDRRLERTLRLIAQIAESNQVLLFTCREDVVRAAEAVRAPVIRL